jgi:hypothetical protein
MKLLLPGLSHLSDSIENALTTMATAIVTQTDEARTARAEKQLREETPKLPSDTEKFKHTIHILMRYLNLDDEESLPILWHEWANCGKKQELNILKNLLENYAQGPTTFIAKSPIITPKLIQELLAFNFVGEHRDDVNIGLSPFNVVEGGETHRRYNLELSKVQGALYQNDVGFNLQDLDALQKRELKMVPITYFDLEKTLGLLGNLFGVVLGDAHTLTTHYRLFWELLSRNLRDDIRDLIDIQISLRPAHLLRSVQLVIHSWFSTRRLNLAPPTPSFMDILLRIQTASYQLPGLPGIYHELTYATKPQQQPAFLTPPTSISSNSMSGSSDLSTLSGSLHPGQLTGASGLRPTAPSTTQGRNTFVRNAEPDTTLQAMIPSHLQLRNVIQSDPVPLNDMNQPMCLSYHLRRGCWSQCKRAADHNKKLSGAERHRIVAFLNTQLRKLSAVTPPTTVTVSAGSATLPVTTTSTPAPGLAQGTPPARG